MKNNLNTYLTVVFILIIIKFSKSQATFSYEFNSTNIQILNPPSPVAGEYLGPNYNLINKPLIAQPFANNAGLFNVASQVHTSAGSINNVFFGGDEPAVHGYFDVSTMITTKNTFNKNDFPILMESNFYSNENIADYNEFYFWIGNANAPYYCSATTVLPKNFESKEGLLVGSTPFRSVVFNGLDNQQTGITLYDNNNSFFIERKWSKHKVLFDLMNDKLVIVGYWIDDNCIINALEDDFLFVDNTPWLNNFRLGVCIDDLGQGLDIITNYQYYEIESPTSICVNDCVDFKITFDELFCNDNFNAIWSLEGADYTSVNDPIAETICYNKEGTFAISLHLNDIQIFTDEISIVPCSESNFDNVLVLDGCTNYYEIPENNLLDYNGNLSIEAWIKPNCEEGNKMIVAKEWCNGDQFAYYLSVNEGKLHWQFDEDGNCTPTNGFNTIEKVIPTDKFTHVAVVHSEIDIKLYVNGVLESSNYISGGFTSINNSSEPLRIGVYKGIAGNFGNYFSGAIDELRIWNVALSQTNIGNRMNKKLSGQENGLVAYYDMAENGVGTLLPLINKSSYGSIFNGKPFGVTINTPYVINWNEYLYQDLVSLSNIDTCFQEMKVGIPKKMYKSILWNTGEKTDSIVITNSGVYSIIAESEMCRIFKDTITVNFNSSIETNLNYTLCDNETLTIGNETYSQSGNYTQNLQTINGCDSIININLNFQDAYEFYSNRKICFGDSLNFFDTWVKEPGEYFESYVAVNGCDSIYYLNLEIESIEEHELKYMICDGETISINNETYNKEGTYTQNLVASDGCDSLLSINITQRSTDPGFEYQFDNCSKELKIIDTDNNNGKIQIKQDGVIKYESYDKVFTLSTGKFEVINIINDSTLCRMESTQTIEIGEQVQLDDISFPNIIAPDLAVNNEFCVSNSLADYFIFESLKIYDRFGNLVFRTSNADVCWDGRFNQKNCEAGVYTYIIEVYSNECKNPKYMKTGDVTVVR